MKLSMNPRILMLVAAGAALGACTSPDPVKYQELDSSAYLRPNPDSNGGRIPYAYKTQTDWRAYDKVILDPVTIYNGADAQFSGISEQDKRELASYMRKTFGDSLSTRFALVQAPGARTLRIHLTMTGAARNRTFLGTASRFDIGGGTMNGIQAIRGREGVLTGSILYAVEIYDARTGKLLQSDVVKEYPGVYNLSSTSGALSAARKGIDKGAAALVEQL